MFQTVGQPCVEVFEQVTAATGGGGESPWDAILLFGRQQVEASQKPTPGDGGTGRLGGLSGHASFGGLLPSVRGRRYIGEGREAAAVWAGGEGV